MKLLLTIPCLLLAMLFSNASLATTEPRQGETQAEASASKGKPSRNQERQEFNALDALVNSNEHCESG
ncbi:MAG: hypothetical protein K0A95_03365 [Chromatiales bacterium]|nr:hypothetical protein [Gammaproteobacteria bacterium]MBW6476098.1 hypothetical protein [Chromatiales bacterium]